MTSSNKGGMESGRLFLGFCALVFVLCRVDGDPEKYFLEGVVPATSLTLPQERQSDYDFISSEGDDCVCVPVSLCYNGSVNKNGFELIDFRIGHGKNCKNNKEVCCKVPDILPGPNQKTNQNRCGVRNPSGVNYKKFEGENQVQFGEFPWMIALLDENITKETDTYKHFKCGGSLIHPKVVLTAAHCIAGLNVSKLIVRAGEWNMDLTLELLPHQDRKVHEAVIHYDFQSGPAHNDIALLLLDEPFSKADNVGVICLPSSKDEVSDSDCIVTGWGITTDDVGEEFWHILKQVTVPMIPRDQCEKTIKNTYLGENYKLHESFVCAGGKKADACEGNGGSPLICLKRVCGSKQYQQVGIVSWGMGCGIDVPGIYTNVAYLTPWINEQMTKFGLTNQYH